LSERSRLAESCRAEEEKLMTKIIDASLKLKIWKDTHGQDFVEYALMAGFLGAASGFTLPAVAADIATVFSKVILVLSGGGGDTAPGA
jgi:pilus assembly protein Flp/PilA